MSRFRFGWWTTGRDQAAIDLFDTVWKAVEDGRIDGDFAYLFCSRVPGESDYSDRIIQLAAERAIPVESISAVNFKPELRKSDREAWRDLYHKEVYEAIKGYGTDLAILAGYMWVLSAEICRKINAINLHPALPGGPAGTWQEVIWQLLEAEAGETGAMMHLVTPELDKGPAVTFYRFPIKGPGWDALWEEFRRQRQELGMEGVKERFGEDQPLFKKIRQEGVKRELPLIVETIRALAAGEISLKNGVLYGRDGQPLSGPYDLTEQIEEAISRG